MIPPVHSGIEPSLFAALIAPIGVNSLPSLAVSSAEDLAITPLEVRATVTANNNVLFFIVPFLSVWVFIVAAFS